MKAVFKQDGHYLDYTPDVAVSAGDVVISGALIGIAVGDIAANATGVISTSGVYEIVKDSGAITLGAKVYWDASGKVATATSTSNTEIGVAVLAAAEGDSTCLVKLG